MNCLSYEELFSKLRDGIIDDKGLGALKAHVEKCSSCRREYENLEKLKCFLKESFQPETEAVEARDSILSKLSPIQPATAKERKRTMFERLRKPAFAAAAIMAVIAVLLLTGVFKAGTTAYAFEQTVEATREMRSIHLKVESEENITELWAEFGEDGQVLQARIDQPITEDGPKEMIWQAGQVEVWLKDRNTVVVARHEEVLKEMRQPVDHSNPKTIIEELHAMQAEGKATIEVQEPSKAGEPIILTAIMDESPDLKAIYFVDPVTKLVQELETHKSIDGQYQLKNRITYLEYNQRIDPKLFTLDVPADTFRLDWTIEGIGLAQGDLSDEEMAVKVAREFYEALIAQDYEKASQIFSAFPADKLEEALKDIKYLRIISVGDPIPIENTMPQSYRVPCTVEFEKDGDTHTHSTDELRVRPVHGQTDRWWVYGGF